MKFAPAIESALQCGVDEIKRCSPEPVDEIRRFDRSLRLAKTAKRFIKSALIITKINKIRFLVKSFATLHFYEKTRARKH